MTTWASESFRYASQTITNRCMFRKHVINCLPEKSAALNASRDTAHSARLGLPQEKVQNLPVGDVRISPSLSCNTEFPSIMFLSMLLACPVESAWKCGTNAIVFPCPWSNWVLSRRTGPSCRGYSWPGVDGPTVSLSSVLEPLNGSLKLCQWSL